MSDNRRTSRHHGSVSGDRAALDALHVATNGPAWTNNDGWTSDDLSGRFGVTVNDEGRVVVVKLLLGDRGGMCESNLLKGAIPLEVGNLGALQELILACNKLRGGIPATLGNLSALRVLDLSGNRLSGGIPATLGNLSALEDLDLGASRLSGGIPATLGNLSSLRVLELERTFLSGGIPATLGNLSALQQLCLRRNPLSGGIPATLGNLSALRELDLSGNGLSGGIPAALGGLSALRVLDLGANGLSGGIPAALGGLSALEELSLVDNRLSGGIPAALGKLSALEVLELNENLLSGGIPAALGNLSALRYLTLNNNRLSGGIPAALGSLSALEDLRLNNNRLSGGIPATLGSLSALRLLLLGENLLSGTVPPAMWNSSIKLFDVDNNLLDALTDPEAGPDARNAAVAFVCSCEITANLAGNRWMLPPAAVIDKGKTSMASFYYSWAKCGTLDCTRNLKVVFVGAAGAGKTSLVESIVAGRGRRVVGDDPSTVGAAVRTHKLDDGLESKLYDMAGQVNYYGLYQMFLTESAVYVLVFNAKKFEGLAGADLDKAIHTNIMEWMPPLNERSPRCSVMLVASHCDELGRPTEQAELLQAVENRLTELHQIWRRKRRRLGRVDGCMQLLPGVIAVSCEENYEPNGIAGVVENVLQFAQTVYLPPTWSLARVVLEETAFGDGAPDATGASGAPMASGVPRPWVTRTHLHDAFYKRVKSLETDHPLHGLLDDEDIKNVMDEALD